MTKEEITEKAQELTIKNVTDGKNKYFSWGFYKGCVVALEYNNKRIAELKAQIENMKCCANCKKYWRMCEYGDREMQICDKWELAND